MGDFWRDPSLPPVFVDPNDPNGEPRIRDALARPRRAVAYDLVPGPEGTEMTDPQPTGPAVFLLEVAPPKDAA